MKKLFILSFMSLSSSLVMAQWNPNTSVNLEIAGLTADVQEVATTSDGKTWIAYYHPVKGDYNMRAQLLDQEGNKLLGDDGILVNDNITGSATFVFNVLVDRDDNFIIAAQDMRTEEDYTVVAHKVNQKGENLWNGKNGVVLGVGLAPYLTQLSNDEIIVSWANSGKIGLQKINKEGSKAWTNPKEMTLGAGKLSRGQLAPMSDSGFVMVFQSGGRFGIASTLYAMRYKNNGDSSWKASLQLSNESTSGAIDYSIIHDADTTYFGYYSSTLSSRFNSWLQRVNPDGTLPYGINGAPFSIYRSPGEPNQMATSIASEPGSPYVWAVASMCNSGQSEYGVAVQKFNKADGKALLDIYGKEIYPINADRFAMQGKLALSQDRPLFMVCSDQDYLIKATVLDENGDFILPWKDEVISGTLIPRPSAETKGRFAFTKNVDGQSVALWVENRGAGNRAYAQNFDLKVYDTSVVVTVKDDAPATITVKDGTLQLEAKVLPKSVDQEVTWSLINPGALAHISETGLVTAYKDGTVWAKAVSKAVPAYADSIEITISNQTTAIGDITAALGFRLYPNPVEHALYLSLTKAHPVLQWKITDLYGRMILEDEVASNSLNSPVAIDISRLSSGVYLFHLQGEGVRLSEKIIKR